VTIPAPQTAGRWRSARVAVIPTEASAAEGPWQDLQRAKNECIKFSQLKKFRRWSTLA